MRLPLVLAAVLLSVSILSLPIRNCAAVPASPDFLSQEELRWLREHGDTIRLAPDPYFPPLEFFDERGELRGIAPAYVRLLEERLQIHFVVLRLKDFEAILDGAKRREVDVAATVIETPERSEYLLFTPPYIRIPNVIVVRDDTKGQLSIDDLKKLKDVVFQGGYAIGDVLRTRHGVAARPVTDPAAALRDLSTGRIDAMVGNLATISYYARASNLSNLRVAGDCGFDDTLSFASRSDQPLLNTILRKAMERITPEERNAVRNEWIRLEDVPFYRQRTFLVFFLGGTCLCVGMVALLFGWNRTLKKQVARKTAELEQRTIDLQLKNEEMTRFMYTVSHDLRSPLVTIKAFVGFVEKDLRRQNAEAVARDLNFMKAAADKMGNLLDELLELSRIGRSDVSKREIPLQEVARSALALVAGRIASRGVSVTTTDEPVLLFGDVRRLVELYQNLLDNAAKYMGSQENPRIEIGVMRTGDETTLFVRDNGQGIEPSMQERLFGIFEKFDPQSDGVGMGLAIVKRIVEVHGGHIRVESEGRGKGTTFLFTLAGTRYGSSGR